MLVDRPGARRPSRSIPTARLPTGRRTDFSGSDSFTLPRRPMRARPATLAVVTITVGQRVNDPPLAGERFRRDRRGHAGRHRRAGERSRTSTAPSIRRRVVFTGQPGHGTVQRRCRHRSDQLHAGCRTSSARTACATGFGTTTGCFPTRRSCRSRSQAQNDAPVAVERQLRS